MALYVAERSENSPFLNIRVGKILTVYHDEDAEGIPSDAKKSLAFLLGRVKVQWLDWEGERDFIRLSFPVFSNSTVNTGEGETRIGTAYGDISMPSVGDVAIIGFRDPTNAVVLGYLPRNYQQQTSTAADKPLAAGTLRRVKPGELSRQSAQAAEIYQDQGGAVQIIVKAQPVSDNSDNDIKDGSDTNKATDINATKAASTEIARVTVGEAYTDETFTARTTNSQDKKVILQVKMSSGASISIDTEGNIEAAAASGKEILLNNGTKGVARLDDAVKSTPTEDSTYWTFISTLIDALLTSTTTPADGGATYKAGITTKLASIGISSGSNAPQSLDSKITESSDTVKAGD